MNFTTFARPDHQSVGCLPQGVAPVLGNPELNSYPPHPRTIGWFGTAALAMGGSNQSLFLIGALLAGQGDIPGQGTAAIPLLIVGLLLSYAAAPGWTELVLMSPQRVGGIAAACTAAFRPYSEILSALTGVCYWWGWVPTCGVTAIFSATAINQWALPSVPVPVLAVALVLLFTAVNLCGIKWVTRLAIPIATASAGLAFVSMIAPVLSGSPDWQQAASFHLATPFSGVFGGVTSVMAGLYLIGFGAPAFEAALCHVAETRRPGRNVPRAVFASGAMAAVYFAVLPVIWLCAIGADPLGGDLGQELGPTFAPWFGSSAKAAAIWFMMLNMFHGTIQPLAGASRTLSQLSEDGLLPRFLALRMPLTDVPWTATLLTAAFAIAFLLVGDPIWLIAAANFTYLIGICLPSVAVWLLRRDAPQLPRPYRAPRGLVGLGVASAAIWLVTALLGFQQFGLPTVVLGLLMAYSGAVFYGWRKIEDRLRAGLSFASPSLHIKLTGAMLLVLALDAAGYIVAVNRIPLWHGELIVVLEDIFVAVAVLTIGVGVVLPGLIAHSANQISTAARRLAFGPIRDFSDAMEALGRGNLDGDHHMPDLVPVVVGSNDELGAMADSFNLLQHEVLRAANGLDRAREGLRGARNELTGANAVLHTSLAAQRLLTTELLAAKEAAEAGNRSKAEFLAVMSHELRTPLNGVIGMAGLLLDGEMDAQSRHYAETMRDAGDQLLQLINDVLDLTKLDSERLEFEAIQFEPIEVVQGALELVATRAHDKGLELAAFVAGDVPQALLGDPGRLRQVLNNLIGNAVKFTASGAVSVEVMRAEPPPGTLLAPGQILLAFEVHDSGIGIAQEDLPLLFQDFQQVDSSISRRFGGTGLGLAICRKLVNGMGGTISASSVAGQGSVFRFSVTLQVSESHSGEAVAEPVRVDGLRVLVVDDNAVNRSIFCRQIENRGGHVVAVESAERALIELASAVARGAPFSAAVIDHAMPGTDGVTLADSIRASTQYAALRLVLATSSVVGPAARRSAERVFDVVMTKPVAPDALMRALLPVAADRRPVPAVQPASAPVLGARHLRVLVAEDNPTNQIVTRAHLERLGHRADMVGNGLEALAAVKSLPYDVVLMDVMMPDMDGVQATRLIRALPAPTGNIVIIGLTAHASGEDHAAFRAAGMNSVISKPMTRKILGAALEGIVLNTAQPVPQ